MSPSRTARDARPATRNSLKWLVGGAIVALGLIGGTAWIVLGTRSAQQDQRPVAQLPAQVQNVHGLTWSPGGSEADGQTQEGLVILGHHAGALASEDGGRTWRPFAAANLTDEVRVIAGQGTVIYLAGQARLLKSTDGGRAWAPLSHDLPGSQVEALAVAPEDPAGVYAVVAGQGLFRSGDGGSHWEQVSPTLPRNVSGLAVASNGWLYLATFDQGVLTSRDGRAWAPASGFVTGALPTLQIAALAHDAQSGDSYLTPTGERLTGALYAGTDRGLFKSVDGGTSWLRLPLETDVQALAVHPARSDTLLVVDSRGRVFRSGDRGLTWE
jgi:photosystem II stability/assembly factor-like uncharacterized protein